jgi:hypothetical protein
LELSQQPLSREVDEFLLALLFIKFLSDGKQINIMSEFNLKAK